MSGRGAAWLARLLWEQEVGGSNPPVPTSFHDLFLGLCGGQEAAAQDQSRTLACNTPASASKTSTATLKSGAE
jgi:hypothetical protein